MEGAMASFFKDMFTPKAMPAEAAAAHKLELAREIQELKLMPYQRRRARGGKAQVPLTQEEVNAIMLLDHRESVRSTKGRGRSAENASATRAPEKTVVAGKYFDAEFDPVLDVLKKLPDAVSTDDLITFVLEEMAETKVQMKQIHEELSALINQNYTLFLDGAKTVKSVDLDVTRASLYAKTSRRRLSRLRKRLVEGDLRVLREYRRKERAKITLEKLHVLASLVRRKQGIYNALKSGQLMKAINSFFVTLTLVDRLKTVLKDYTVLVQLRSSLLNMLPTLRHETDKLLMNTIASFDSRKYLTIINAYREIDSRQGQAVQMQEKSHDELAPELSKLVGKVEKIVGRQCEEALRQALIDVVRGCEAYPGGSPLSISFVQARAQSLEQLCNHVTTSCTKPSLVRSLCKAYETICSLIHNFDLISQWHAGTQDKELQAIGKDLLACKKSVWSVVQVKLKQVLESVVCRYPNLSVESFHNLSLITTALATVGGTFGGNTSVLSTRALIRDIGRGYVVSFHLESLEGLKGVLKEDPFVRKQQTLRSLGGIEGLLHVGKERQLLRENSLEDSLAPLLASMESWDMSQYDEQGNPFTSLLAQLDSLENESKQSNGHGNGEDLGRKQSTEELAKEEFVLTKTVTECMAADVGRYLFIMSKLPLVASETFQHLRQLYSTYISTVLANFVRGKDLSEVFDNPGSLLGSRFQRLRQYITLVRQFDQGVDMGVESQVPQSPVQLSAELLGSLDDLGLTVQNISFRLVAAESLSFAFQLLLQIKSSAEELLSPVERSKQSAEIYSDMATAIQDLKKFIYKSVSMGLLESELLRQGSKKDISLVPANFVSGFLEGMEWTSGASEKEKHSLYVQQMFELMKGLWDELEKSYSSSEKLPARLLGELWDLLVESLFDLLLDAYVRVDNCPIQGRSRMIQDVEALSQRLYKVRSCGEIGKGGEERVVRFLKAFYYERESDVRDWMRKNQRQYQQEHLDCLRNAVLS